MGLDAKIGVSSNFTIDLTVNPDFGQVESDPSVLNLSAFETFYLEKRPFFMEVSTIFNYNFDDQSLFYSRRIGHSPFLTVNPNDSLFVNSPDKTTILSAIKFSETTSKGLSVGLIQSVTANEYARLSDSDGNRSSRKVEPFTNYMVARVRKDTIQEQQGSGGHLAFTSAFTNQLSLMANLIYHSRALDTRISRGSYSEFKRVTNPEAKLYDDRFEVYNKTILTGGTYGLYENNDLLADYYIGNPDFNFHQLRSNFVAKWEYRLGSFIYLVWSSERSGRTSSSRI